MNKSDIATVIVPDVHGRKFWKDVEKFPKEKIVFLGDYLDPYPFEGISKMDAFENFADVLEFAKTNKDRVTLLLGNHDCEYAIGTNVCYCRCDTKNYDTISGLFLDNKEMFSFVKKVNAGGEEFVLSHAGLHPLWLQKWKKHEGVFKILYNSHLEECNFAGRDIAELENDDWYNFMCSLCDVSEYRGGTNWAGSPVWADIREYFKEETELGRLPFKQIVGHTYLDGVAVGNDYITCIDTQQIYILGKDGKLYDKNLEPAQKITIKDYILA